MTEDRLTELIDNAQEAETDPGRHEMEEAILATLATAGFDTEEVALAARSVNWERADFKAIAAALIETITEGKVPDRVVIADKLRSARIQDKILADIMEGEGKAKDVSIVLEYIKIMNVQDKKRAAEDFGREYMKAIKEGDTEAAFADLSRKVFDLATEKKLVRDYPVEAIAAEGFLDTLNVRRAAGRRWTGLDCGFDHLNEVLNGLPEGVVILAGAPSCGKTTLAKQIGDHVAMTEKVPVLFYSFEQSAEELRIKSLARLSSVDSRDIWKGRTGMETWSRVEKAAEDYRRKPGPYLKVIEAGRKDTVETIRASALMEKRKAGNKPILLILDYLQIIPAGDNAREALRERIDANLSELRRLSRDLKSPVLVISSENREAYKGNNQPTLAALKESGGIEYSADVVICLWRNKIESENLTKQYTRLTVRVEAHVLKNRNGELAKVKLDFTPAWALFTERDKERLDWSDALGE